MQGWMGMGTKLKLLAGIGVGMGIRVAGTVGDGYKYLSPCSSLVVANWGRLGDRGEKRKMTLRDV